MSQPNLLCRGVVRIKDEEAAMSSLEKGQDTNVIIIIIFQKEKHVREVTRKAHMSRVVVKGLKIKSSLPSKMLLGHQPNKDKVFC